MSLPWLEIAEKELGVKEVPGPGDNPRVIEYHQATKLKATEDSVAWCSAFVNWVMKKAGCERTYSAAARSWLGYGPHIEPKRGAIVIFSRGSNPWQGHVAIIEEVLADSVKVIGGNQGDKVSYAVYPKSRILGCVWPKPIAKAAAESVLT